MWLHVISDVLVALACFAIPAALLHLVARRRREVPFPGLLLLFGAFITACGVTHALGVWTVWHGTYGIEGLLELASAMMSVVIALVMIPILPRALALSAANERLRREVRERRQTEERLRHLAQHDALTGLPNRVLLRDRLVQAVAKAHRERRRVAVMMLDLDDFKRINDTFGHPLGDRLLRIVAERLSAGVRASDTVARLGGDEFAVIQTGLEGIDGAAVLAQKLLDALGRPIELDGHDIHIGGSIGIAVHPEDGAEPADLLAHADMAMYRAKREDEARYRFFAPEMIRAAKGRRTIGGDREHPSASPVDLPPARLRDRDDAGEIAEILEETDPGLLNVGIKKGLLTDECAIDACIERLGEPGIGIPIDKVGAGVASLARLRRLPARRIGIERSLVVEIGLDPDAETIVQAIRRGHGLDARVVGEGPKPRARPRFLHAPKRATCAAARCRPADTGSGSKPITSNGRALPAKRTQQPLDCAS